jgi:hypothetical protein
MVLGGCLLMIDSSGRVGIGTSSVNAKLHVKESTAATYGIIRVEGNNRGGEINFHNGTAIQSAIWGNSNTLNFATGASYTQAMIIDSSQRVGIGTTSPGAALDILGPTSGDQLRISNNASVHYRIGRGTVGGYLEFYGTQSSNNGYIFGGADGERARIDSSGRLLVGTSTARSNFFNSSITAGLQVEGTGLTTARAAFSIVNNDTGSNPSILVLGKSGGATLTSNTLVASGNWLGTVSFQGADGSELVEAASVAGYVDGTPGTNDMPGRLVFSTTADGASSPTERLRIAQNAQLTYNFASDNAFRLINSTAGGKAGTIQIFNSGAFNTFTNLSFNVGSNGDVTNTNNSYGAISDIKLKENIVDANSQWDDLKALQVRNYNFKEGQTHTQIGLVAQEVELVSPGLVGESIDRDEDGNDLGTVTKSVNYSVLYMKAIKALQEAMERIEQLETEMAAVKAQLS